MRIFDREIMNTGRMLFEVYCIESILISKNGRILYRISFEGKSNLPRSETFCDADAGSYSRDR